MYIKINIKNNDIYFIIMKIRIALVNKSTASSDYGDWREKKELLKLKKWVVNQNSIYHNTYYWIEMLENNKIKNFNWELLDYEYVNVNTK